MGAGTPGWHHHRIQATTTSHQYDELFRSGKGISITFGRCAAREVRDQPAQLLGADPAACIEFFGDSMAVQTRCSQQVRVIRIEGNDRAAARQRGIVSRCIRQADRQDIQ